LRILLIEDDCALAAPVIEHLEADHQVVDGFGTLQDVVSKSPMIVTELHPKTWKR
jgi:two-component system OmpR family response regulator